MAVHQQFQVSLDTKPYEAGLVRMETTTKAATSRSAAEFQKVDRSMANAGRSRGMNTAGGIAMQAQDVAIQMQMGVSASRIIAQQGSQIAMLFGPKGMIIGGLVAAGALMWDMANASKKAKQEAADRAKAERQALQLAEARKAADSLEDDQKATALAKIRADQGEKEAEAAARRMQYEEKIANIRNNQNLSPENKAVLEEAARDRFAAEERARFKAEARDRGAARVADKGQELIDRAAEIRQGTTRAEKTREAQRQARAERRAIREEEDRIDRAERNRRGMGTEKARTTGLTQKEREDARKAREDAIGVAKDKKLEAAISQENIDKILNGIDNLIAR